MSKTLRTIFSISIIFSFFTIFQSCIQNQKAKDLDIKPIEWAEKMANSVITSYDSLINYNDPDKIKWQYDVAMLGQAIDKLGYIDQKYSKYLEDYIQYFVEEDGSVKNYKMSDYNLDHINPAKNLFTLYKRTGEEKYLIAIHNFIKQLENQPKTKSGGFWHKKRYPYQMWLDGIYMSSPFMAQYAKEFNKPEWFDTVAFQIILIYKMTVDESTELLYHAWDESKEQKWCDPVTGKSKQFWSRAMGWYAMAIVDVLDYFPENHPKRNELITILNNISEALLKVRDPETGLWYQVLDAGGKEGNYIEASGSSMFTYTFAKGFKKGYLPSKFYETALYAFDAIIEEFIRLDNSGLITVKGICGSAGLGGDPYRDGSYEYYINEKKVDNDPKGVAPFILAAIELKN